MSLKDQVRKKAERKLLSLYRSAISGDNIFPWSVPLNRSALKEDLIVWRNEAESLRKIDKNHSGKPGPVIQTKLVKTRKFGEQIFPEKIVFESAADLLGFLGKKNEFNQLMELVEMSRLSLPQIESWLLGSSSPLRILENKNHWPGILDVCGYFYTRTDFDLYPRLFPLSVHSKFLEENRGVLADILSCVLPENKKNPAGLTFEEKFLIKTMPQKLAVRIPDQDLRNALGIPFSELEVATKELSRIIEAFKGTIHFIIIENKSSYLSFPDVPNGVLIFGSGFLVGALETQNFLHKGRVLYWGDIDAHGFEILSLMREQIPHTETFLMSEEILNQFWSGTVGKPSVKSEDPKALSHAELKLYRHLKNGEKRLEQERLPLHLILEGLKDAKLGSPLL